MKDGGKAKILAALAPDRFEIISENADSVLFADENDNEGCEFTARLRDPSVELLDSIIHVMPGAKKDAPEKEWIIDYMMSLDPAMTAGLSAVYVRAGKRDDKKIMDISESTDENVLDWSDYQDGKLGWHWKEKSSVVVNMPKITEVAKEMAKEAYPERDRAAAREIEAGKSAFEQFFITLGHEIRHAAAEFPLTSLYCEIYPNPERGSMRFTGSEDDAEDWAVDAFEKWRDSSAYGKIAKKLREKADAAGMKNILKP